MPGSETPAKASLLLLLLPLPQARASGTKAVHTQRGGTGQLWLPWGYWMSWLRIRPQTAALGLGLSRAPIVGSPCEPSWGRSGSCSCPRRGFPDLRLGQPLPFPPPVPPHSSPRAPQLPPAGASAPSTRSCPVGARSSSDTQGLKIVTTVHPIGPGICCLIYE